MNAEPLRDPKPLEEMTSEEKKALSKKLREQMRSTPYDPKDDSLDHLPTT